MSSEVSRTSRTRQNIDNAKYYKDSNEKKPERPTTGKSDKNPRASKILKKIVNFKGRGEYYPGEIKKKINNTVDILFDGEEQHYETNVNIEYLKPLNFFNENSENNSPTKTDSELDSSGSSDDFLKHKTPKPPKETSSNTGTYPIRTARIKQPKGGKRKTRRHRNKNNKKYKK